MKLNDGEKKTTILPCRCNHFYHHSNHLFFLLSSSTSTLSSSSSFTAGTPDGKLNSGSSTLEGLGAVDEAGGELGAADLDGRTLAPADLRWHIGCTDPIRVSGVCSEHVLVVYLRAEVLVLTTEEMGLVPRQEHLKLGRTGLA